MKKIKGQFKKEGIYEKFLSDYAFTLNNIKNNIFRLGKNETGEIIYLLNEGPIPNKFQLTTDVVYGKTMEEIFGKESSKSVLEYFARAFRGEIVQFQADFEHVWFEVILSPIEIDGEIAEVAGSSYDITERINYQKEIEKLNSELRHLSSTDKLTGLGNRYKLDEMLKYEILQSKRYNKDLSVIFFDIDNFKIINDEFGHFIGDEVLKEVSSFCEAFVRDTDTFGRWGGDEFLIICPETSMEKIASIAERIRKAMESNTFSRQLSVTASFGVGAFKTGMDVDNLMKEVDNAMYEAKRKGRNIVATATTM